MLSDIESVIRKLKDLSNDGLKIIAAREGMKITCLIKSILVGKSKEYSKVNSRNSY